MRLIVTRPLEDAAPLKAQLENLGHEVVLAPMMEIVLQPRPLDLAGIQALLATSASGARALAASTPRRDLALFAVGEATARAARAAGFTPIETAGGDARALARLVVARLDPARGALFHAAGSVTAGDLKGDLERAGFAIVRQALYEARAMTVLPPDAGAALKRATIDGVLLFSPRTARVFGELAKAAGLEESLSKATAFCLSEAVAHASRVLPFGHVAVAAFPDTASLLALIVASSRGLN